jgi:hexosaminidase
MEKIHIIPQPSRMEMTSGTFTLTPKTRIVVPEDAHSAGEYLAQRLMAATGFHIPVTDTEPSKQRQDRIILRIDAACNASGSEGYALSVQDHLILISASAPAGIFYGCQTLLQLFPTAIESPTPVQGISWTIPQIEITDTPRFSWRGMHLDVCRHFMPREFVKKYIDLIARYKMNTFHWHLTEDQGWRIQIAQYPKLTEIGAWRLENGKQYGGYYTQAEIRDIVEHATNRCVTIVPEIEMPGHSVAALAAYPEFSCTGGPFEVRSAWGIAEDVYCAGNDQTFTFLENILAEVIDLFPGKYLHIGGDECPKTRWKACPKCQARIQTEGLNDEFELQSYFIKRIGRYLRTKNRQMIGWDEILEGGLAPGAMVMSWRGMEGGMKAAQLGHDVVTCPTSHCYFDRSQRSDDDFGTQYYNGPLSFETVYAFEPIPPELSPEQANHIVGSQGNVWTEFIPTPEQVEYMVLPRMGALAEVLWSDNQSRNLEDFSIRLASHNERFDVQGLKYCRREVF